MFYINTHNGYEQIIEKNDGGLKFIPIDETNSDYQNYLAWVAEGNTAEEWSPEDGN